MHHCCCRTLWLWYLLLGGVDFSPSGRTTVRPGDSQAQTVPQSSPACRDAPEAGARRPAPGRDVAGAGCFGRGICSTGGGPPSPTDFRCGSCSSGQPWSPCSHYDGAVCSPATGGPSFGTASTGGQSCRSATPSSATFCSPCTCSHAYAAGPPWLAVRSSSWCLHTTHGHACDASPAAASVWTGTCWAQPGQTSLPARSNLVDMADTARNTCQGSRSASRTPDRRPRRPAKTPRRAPSRL